MIENSTPISTSNPQPPAHIKKSHTPNLQAAPTAPVLANPSLKKLPPTNTNPAFSTNPPKSKLFRVISASCTGGTNTPAGCRYTRKT